MLYRMKANLHLHSRLSDGTEWPADLAVRAYQSGLEWVALTDHDTLGGPQKSWGSTLLRR